MQRCNGSTMHLTSRSSAVFNECPRYEDLTSTVREKWLSFHRLPVNLESPRFNCSPSPSNLTVLLFLIDQPKVALPASSTNSAICLVGSSLIVPSLVCRLGRTFQSSTRWSHLPQHQWKPCLLSSTDWLQLPESQYRAAPAAYSTENQTCHIVIGLSDRALLVDLARLRLPMLKRASGFAATS